MKSLKDAMNAFAEKLWLLESFTHMDSEMMPIMADTCPFCIKQNADHGGNLICTNCEYAAKHGKCSEGTWYAIMQSLRKAYIDSPDFWKQPLGSGDLARFRVIVSTTASKLRGDITLDEFMKLKVSFMSDVLKLGGFFGVAEKIEREYW